MSNHKYIIHGSGERVKIVRVREQHVLIQESLTKRRWMISDCLPCADHWSHSERTAEALLEGVLTGFRRDGSLPFVVGVSAGEQTSVDSLRGSPIIATGYVGPRARVGVLELG